MKYVVAVCLLLLTLLAASSAFAQEPGSKVYIPPSAPNQTVDDGNKVVTTTAPAFNLVMQAELFKAKLPLTLVTDPAQATYTMQWAAIPEEERTTGHVNFGHAVGTGKELYTVSASLLDRDKQLVWAGSADKKNLHECAVDITRQLKDSMKHKK